MLLGLLYYAIIDFGYGGMLVDGSAPQVQHSFVSAMYLSASALTSSDSFGVAASTALTRVAYLLEAFIGVVLVSLFIFSLTKRYVLDSR